MKLAILGANGRTGQELVRQALRRGHHVVALMRDPAQSRLAPQAQLQLVRVDAFDPASLRQAITPDVTVLSALGTVKGGPLGVLDAGARACVAARPARILWLGAFGTGASAQVGGWAVRTLLGLALRRDLPDKVAADSRVLSAGGTVFHAGPLSNRPISAARRAVGLAQIPARFFPASISRATVAAAMLDEAEAPKFAGRVAVPLEG
ncbi:NAD(P)-dependent oxidoreductase [Roseateles amylovorans]|uniref:NAD(P)H-binding protein n=1 Tax=Roseateles amylovorans TaxID=2978473 RepID=A0ABY6B3F5_9BURK|nr:NAD(P)H-binding protein [Roseateles amylovorans]UXH79078.1 NAD(P)H-binding protein [Roseateles amylovorans]